MPVKILACGDPHFKTDNIPEVELFTERIEKLAQEKKPDLIVILGDLLHYHERLHVMPLNKAYNFVERMREISPTYVLVGNHDYCNNRQYLTENHWMNAMKEWENVTVVDTVHHLQLNGTHLVFLPYVPPGKFKEALNTHEEDWKNADCIFAHQEFFGCKMGAIISEEGDKWPTDFPEVVSGHIHSRQKPQDNVYYCGSAMQHAFGESEKNIIPLLTWEEKGEKYDLEEIDLLLPRKRIVYKDIADLEDYVPEETEDKIKITVTGNYEEFKAIKKTKKYKDLVKSGKRVVFKPKKLTQESNKKMDEPIDETDFNKILSALVNNERNEYLLQVHDLVVLDKKISKDNIFFIPESK